MLAKRGRSSIFYCSITQMASPRSVLVTFTERNKKIDILDKPDGESDLVYLKRCCLRTFNFGSNVRIELTLQKYNDDWASLIDLEDDYVASHYDKLKLIVTPTLNDSCSSSLEVSTLDDIYFT